MSLITRVISVIFSRFIPRSLLAVAILAGLPAVADAEFVYKNFDSDLAPAISHDHLLQATPSFDDGFDPDWLEGSSAWRIATWMQNGTQMSRDRCQIDGQGNMVQTVLAGTPYRGGSMETKGEFPWGRWVARVRPSSVPGALNSFFIKDWDDRTTNDSYSDGTSCEVDIEFLTYSFGENTGQVHLAIHLGGHDNYHNCYVTLDFNPSDEFHDWGFDILPDRVVWHVDGKFLHEWRYEPNARINANYECFINSWTMDIWINGPPATDALYAIDRVQFYPFTEPENFEAWKSRHGIEGAADDDPGSHGVPLLLRYAQQLDPISPRRVCTELRLVDGSWQLEFPMRAYTSDLRFNVHTSTDLLAWSAPIAYEVDSYSTDEFIESVTIDGLGTAPNIFLQVDYLLE